MAERARVLEGVHPARPAGRETGSGAPETGTVEMPSRGTGSHGSRGRAIRGDASGLARPDGLRTHPPGNVRQEIPHARSKNGVGMTEHEQQVLAGYMARLGAQVERLGQLAEEVASALGAMKRPASALPQEPAGKAV